MVEFVGACGYAVAVNPQEIAMIERRIFLGEETTMICLKNGKKVILNELYAEVVEAVQEALHGNGQSD